MVIVAEEAIAVPESVLASPVETVVCAVVALDCDCESEAASVCEAVVVADGSIVVVASDSESTTDPVWVTVAATEGSVVGVD